MKRATVTIPDDLEKAVDSYVRAQEAPPPLTAVVQAALREYLADRGFLQGLLGRCGSLQLDRAVGGMTSARRMIGISPSDEAICIGRYGTALCRG
jgi:hypothetical protein